jgi:hypothetical protein
MLDVSVAYRYFPVAAERADPRHACPDAYSSRAMVISVSSGRFSKTLRSEVISPILVRVGTELVSS